MMDKQNADEGAQDIAQQIFIINKQFQALTLSYDDALTKVHTPNIVPNETVNDGAESPLSMQAVIDCIVMPNTKASQQILRRVNSDVVYFTWYKNIVTSLALMQSERRVAASSNGSADLTGANQKFTRRGDGFLITIQKFDKGLASSIEADVDISSLAKSDGQVVQYKDEIVLTLDNSDESGRKTISLHCEQERQMHIVSLLQSDMYENTFTARIPQNDKRLSVIANENSHLYLT